MGASGEGSNLRRGPGGGGPGLRRGLLVYCAGPMRSGGKYVGYFHEIIRVVEGLGHCALTELSSTIRWGALEGLTDGADGLGGPARSGEWVDRDVGRAPGGEGAGMAALLRGGLGRGRGADACREGPIEGAVGDGLGGGGAKESSRPSSIDAYIYERDLHWLDRADALIAEVSSPSLGVGYELSYALHVRRIPSLCLCHRDVRSLSAMVSGNTSPLLRLERYDGSEALRVTIIDFIERISKEKGR